MEQFIEDSSLEDWKVIGSGGFGQIYKARHRQWACDVAIKMLRHDDGTNASLLREIKRMQEEVIRVLGIFKGLPPNTKSGFSAQLGVVMELMERGSLASLQLTDFGLSQITYSVTQVSKKDDKEGGGSL